jgi:hypothetical protein
LLELIASNALMCAMGIEAAKDRNGKRQPIFPNLDKCGGQSSR